MSTSKELETEQPAGGSDFQLFNLLDDSLKIEKPRETSKTEFSTRNLALPSRQFDKFNESTVSFSPRQDIDFPLIDKYGSLSAMDVVAPTQASPNQVRREMFSPREMEEMEPGYHERRRRQNVKLVLFGIICFGLGALTSYLVTVYSLDCFDDDDEDYNFTS